MGAARLNMPLNCDGISSSPDDLLPLLSLSRSLPSPLLSPSPSPPLSLYPSLSPCFSTFLLFSLPAYLRLSLSAVSYIRLSDGLTDFQIPADHSASVGESSKLDTVVLANSCASGGTFPGS